MTTDKEAVRVDAWQPIETAPKDGTWVWVFVPFVAVPKGNSNWKILKAPRQMSAKWVTCPEDTIARTLPRHAKFLDARQGGYWTSHAKGFRPIHGLPSHWMPLPAPPATQGGEGERT